MSLDNVTIQQWIKDNQLVVVTIAIILIVIIYKAMKNRMSKPKKKENLDTKDPMLFDMKPEDLLEFKKNKIDVLDYLKKEKYKKEDVLERVQKYTKEKEEIEFLLTKQIDEWKKEIELLIKKIEEYQLWLDTFKDGKEN
mgnify:CR=1 FL=1